IQGIHKRDSSDPRVWQLAFELALYNPDQKPEEALSLLNRMIAKFGDSPSLRARKAYLFSQIGDEGYPQKISALVENLVRKVPSENPDEPPTESEFTFQEKVSVHETIASLLTGMGQ